MVTPPMSGTAGSAVYMSAGIHQPTSGKDFHICSKALEHVYCMFNL